VIPRAKEKTEALYHGRPPVGREKLALLWFGGLGTRPRVAMAILRMRDRWQAECDAKEG